ncbi:MAG: hypothetical protein WD276_06040 [Actinomycetota bacterium]
MPKKQSKEDYSRKGDKSQRTDKGLKIPVPDKDDFLRALGKAAPKPEESEKEPRRTRPSE